MRKVLEQTVEKLDRLLEVGDEVLEGRDHNEEIGIDICTLFPSAISLALK